jgi:ABC-2 type transport system ATP-binding protein
MPESVAALATERLTKYYGPVIGIEDLDLVVQSGETFGFLGANGAGKTTTIRLILDLLRPSRGRATVGGLDCRHDSVRVRRQIGYLPAEMPVYPELSGRAYLAFLARLQALAPDAAWMTSLLRRFDVSDTDLARPIRDLSHGMKRKLGILQALMGKAPLLILDEPTSGLDPLMIEAFVETVRELRAAGCTVFLSSHVLSEVEKLCDRVGLVSRGRLVKVAGLDEIRDAMPRRVRVVFSHPVSTAPPALAGTRVVHASADEWILEVSGPAGPIVQWLGALPVRDMDIEPATLEEYVLGLYSEGTA